MIKSNSYVNKYMVHVCLLWRSVDQVGMINTNIWDCLTSQNPSTQSVGVRKNESHQVDAIYRPFDHEPFNWNVVIAWSAIITYRSMTLDIAELQDILTNKTQSIQQWLWI